MRGRESARVEEGVKVEDGTGIQLVSKNRNNSVIFFMTQVTSYSWTAAQRRALAAAGPARLTTTTSAYAGVEPLINRAVGGRLHALVGRGFDYMLHLGEISSQSKQPYK